jgi:hypothetical protein
MATTLTYNDYYKYKNVRLTPKGCCPTLQNPVIAMGIENNYCSSPCTSINMITISEPPNANYYNEDTEFYPMLAQKTGCNPKLFLDNTVAPISLSQLTTATPQAEPATVYTASSSSSNLTLPIINSTSTASTSTSSIRFKKPVTSWRLSFNCPEIDFGGSVLQSVGYPFYEHHSANKKYVDDVKGDNWYNWEATSNVQMNGNMFLNTSMTLNHACSTPVLDTYNKLLLTGNGSSFGTWLYSIPQSETITSFQISNMAQGSCYHLLIKGPSTGTATITYCGGGTNYVYTSWSSTITIGPQHMYRIDVFYVNPEYVLTFHAFN